MRFCSEAKNRNAINEFLCNSCRIATEFSLCENSLYLLEVKVCGNIFDANFKRSFKIDDWLSVTNFNFEFLSETRLLHFPRRNNLPAQAKLSSSEIEISFGLNFQGTVSRRKNA